MYTTVIVKAYKAKCLKHLTAARTAIEFETDELVRQLARSSLGRVKDTTPQNRPEAHTPSNCKSVTTALMTPPPAPTPEQGTVLQFVSSTSRPYIFGSNHLCRIFFYSLQFLQFLFTVSMHKRVTMEAPSFELCSDDDDVTENTLPANPVALPSSPVVHSPPRKTRRQHHPRLPLGSCIRETPRKPLNVLSPLAAIKLEDNALASGDKNAIYTKKAAQPGPFAKPSWKLVSGPPRRNSNSANAFYQWATANNVDDSRYFSETTFVINPFIHSSKSD